MQKSNPDRKIEKKCVRYNVPYQAHELTFSCYRGYPLFENLLFCDYLTDAVRKAQEKHDFDVWAYVVMPNHVHLLLYPMHVVYSISLILKSIKQSVARRSISWLRNNQPEQLSRLSTGQKYEAFRFWQDGGGYDRNIFGYESAKSSVHYIHRNPLRKRLVDHPKDWYYSSYRQIYEKVEGPIKVDFRYFPRH